MPTYEPKRGLWKARGYNEHFKRIFLGRFLTKEDAEAAEAQHYERRHVKRRRQLKRSAS